MRLTACALAIASLNACSSTAQVVQTEHAGQAAAQAAKGKQGATAVQDKGWLQVQGMPAVENALLDDVHSSVTVMEAYDERGDVLELTISSASPDGSVNVGIFVNGHLDRSRGLQLTGVYPFDATDRSKQVNLTVDGVIYGSRSGTITLDHAPGTLSGTFVAEVVRLFDATAQPIHIEGHFDDKLDFMCIVLPPATPDPNAQGGSCERDPAAPCWIDAEPDHPVCRSYR
jgi:hypothetical protein